MPWIADVSDLKHLFKGIVDKSDDDTVGAKDEHRTDGNDRDNLWTYAIETATEVDDANNGKEIHHIIEQNMAYEVVLVDVPIE